MKPPYLLALAVWLLSCGWPAMASAETMYVTDQLLLGLYASGDGSGRQLRVIPSGTALEVEEHKGRYARVSTPEGEVGWVKSTYLVAELPALVRIREVEDELQKVRDASGNADSIVTLNKSLERELDILSKELTRALAEVDQLTATLTDTEQAKQQAETDTVAANQAMSAMATTVQRATAREQDAADAVPAQRTAVERVEAVAVDAIGANINRGALLALVAIGLMVLGFFLGYKFLEHHIRRQHGGYRVW